MQYPVGGVGDCLLRRLRLLSVVTQSLYSLSEWRSFVRDSAVVTSNPITNGSFLPHPSFGQYCHAAMLSCCQLATGFVYAQ